jgi:hypothetical protein
VMVEGPVLDTAPIDVKKIKFDSVPKLIGA